MKIFRILLFGVLLLSVSNIAVSQQIPTPEDIIGFELGTNYKLADNEQLENYYRAIADASDRVVLKEIGETHHGNTLLLLIISSEQNLEKLDEYREISEKLALVRDLSSEEASELAEKVKL